MSPIKVEHNKVFDTSLNNLPTILFSNDLNILKRMQSYANILPTACIFRSLSNKDDLLDCILSHDHPFIIHTNYNSFSELVSDQSLSIIKENIVLIYSCTMLNLNINFLKNHTNKHLFSQIGYNIDDQKQIKNSKKLSKQEKAVLMLYAEGQSQKMVAGHLGIGLNTVKTLTDRLYKKLEVHCVTQAIAKYNKDT
jgi:DNA-binding NarL/FixJ family response regulator